MKASPTQKQREQSGTAGTASIHAGFRVPDPAPSIGNNRERMKAIAWPFPLFPMRSSLSGTPKALHRKGCRLFPLFPMKNRMSRNDKRQCELSGSASGRRALQNATERNTPTRTHAQANTRSTSRMVQRAYFSHIYLHASRAHRGGRIDAREKPWI